MNNEKQIDIMSRELEFSVLLCQEADTFGEWYESK